MPRTKDRPALRPELTELPHNMRGLLIDRGYPVPWFVTWLDEKDNKMPDGVGKPEFVRIDPDKIIRATRDKRCYVCGGALGAYGVFVVGPMCVLNRISAEPPCHRDCARWAAINCPFLARPHARRQKIGDKAVGESPGVMITRNPGATCVWGTKTKDITYRTDNGLPLFNIGEPSLVEWYAEGRKATRAEAQASMDSGFPLLLETCEEDPDPEDSKRVLEEKARIAERYLPKSELESHV